jgi:hypothetical protein
VSHLAAASILIGLILIVIDTWPVGAFILIALLLLVRAW